VPRLLATLLIALLPPSPAGATLVVLVPSADGLVVAADSRISIDGKYCDGQFKITRLRKPAHTVVMVTGDGVFIPPPSAIEPDLCRYIQTAPRMLDIASIVRAYLERNVADLSQLSLADLGDECVRAAQRFQQSNPDGFQSHLGGEIFSVVIANYDPKSKVSTIRNFVVRLDGATHQLEAGRFAQTSVAATDRRGVWAFGETAYLEQNVYAGVGRQFLTGSTLGFILDNQPVADTSLDQSIAAAVNVIQATSRATEIVPAPSGIGGPIRAVLLGRSRHPRQLELKPQ
jgi:hypothetical protein